MNPLQNAERLHLTIDPVKHREEYRAYTSVTLPVAAELLYFVATGDRSFGNFELSQTGEPCSDVVVDIDVFYRHEDVLNQVDVCRLDPLDGQYGIGIFTSGGLSRGNGVDHCPRFLIHLRLPAPDTDNVRVFINNLRTDLPRFSHHLHDLAGSAFFDKISLKTHNSSIQAESLAGEAITLSSVNGKIGGAFQASQFFNAQTTNGLISTRVQLLGGETPQATQVTLRTTNGPIEAYLSFMSIAPSMTGGSFNVVAHTSNGPLTIALQDASVGSRLNASLQTTNGPARVTMPPAFEGRFELSSSPFLPPSVNNRSAVGDPAGRGRRRKVTALGGGFGSVRGHVAWEPTLAEGRGDGFVKVQTVNAPLYFSL